MSISQVLLDGTKSCSIQFLILFGSWGEAEGGEGAALKELEKALLEHLAALLSLPLLLF